MEQTSPEMKLRAQALQDFEGANEAELSVKQGEIIQVCYVIVTLHISGKQLFISSNCRVTLFSSYDMLVSMQIRKILLLINIEDLKNYLKLRFDDNH